MTQEEAVSEEALLVSVFQLGGAMFGIPAAQIQEVVQMGSVTRVHGTASYVVGIRNLRGRIVTILDLGMLLELGQASYDADSRILMLDSEGELVGLLVDRAEDTIFLQPSDMSAAPSGLDALHESALRGVYRCAKGLVSLLDHTPILKAGQSKSAGILQSR